MNALWSGTNDEKAENGAASTGGWRPRLIEGGVSDAQTPTSVDVDRHLIDDARRGDSLAVAELYKRHAPLVLGYMRANGNRDAEDAAADVFLSMIRGLSSFDGDGAAFRRWIMTIAHHRMIDGRRQATRRSVECTYVEHVVELDLARSASNAQAMTVDDRLVSALRTITAEQREVIGLRFIADLSLQDVAAITGRSETAIKALQRRGLASLRRALAVAVDPKHGALPAGTLRRADRPTHVGVV